MSGTNATLTGPTNLTVNVQSSDYTITPFFPITGTYTLQTVSGFGGVFVPPSLSWSADATPKTFKYTPTNVGMSQVVPLFSVAGTVTTPPYLNITVTGANAPQHIYHQPQQAGVPPFQVLQTNNQIPGANVIFSVAPQHLYYFPTNGGVPPFQIIQTNFQIAAAIPPPPPPDPIAIIIGTTEAATGTITGIGAAGSYVLMGPWQTPFRISLKEVISVQATGTFNLDYQFTTDFGTTWYPGPQVVSSTSFADGTAYTQRAHMKIEPGFFWRIQIYNTSGVVINAAFERRFVERGQWGT